jgi:hypothetical protein
VSGDGGEEVVALKGVEAGVDGGGHGGGAGNVMEERDLAEVVVFVRGGVVAVGVDVELAGGDDVEAVAALAGADDLVGCTNSVTADSPDLQQDPVCAPHGRPSSSWCPTRYSIPIPAYRDFCALFLKRAGCLEPNDLSNQKVGAGSQKLGEWR